VSDQPARRSSDKPARHAYPADLARVVQERWDVGAPAEPLDVATLEQFFSTCYQASLLREEERAVTFRAILAPPSMFPINGRAPESLQRFDFTKAFSFDAQEVRRLSVATEMQRTLIGVRRDDDGVLRIWGLVNTGTRWLRDVQGGRHAAEPLPTGPVVHVDAPGSIAAHRGDEFVARLQRGKIYSSRADPFTSAWLPERFLPFRDELVARHQAAAKKAVKNGGPKWAELDPELPRRISERMMKRVIAMLRAAHHGGTIVFIPTEDSADLGGSEAYLEIKYRFAFDDQPLAFPDLVVDILNRLAQIHGERGNAQVSWQEFETTSDDQLTLLDEALFETAHLIASLAAADGAVVLNQQHALLDLAE
jgi:hypothetical protein